MKVINNIIILFLVACSLFLMSCEDDFLQRDSNTQYNQDNYYQSEADFRAATAPLYNRVWFFFHEKFSYGVGDSRGNNLYHGFEDWSNHHSDFRTTPTTKDLDSGWNSLYGVVQQSNNVIKGIESSDVDNEIKAAYIAEARFMRGLAYWYLTSLWGDVIISTDAAELVNNPIVNTNPQVDVYEFAIRDMEYAAKYLPTVPVDNGRVSTYSAYAMLSRFYLAYSGLIGETSRDQTYLDMAKKAAEVVINESSFELLDDYEDLFKLEYNNNPESIFALQWVPNSSYGVGNRQQIFTAANAEITGGDAYGQWALATYDMLTEYESNDQRRRATWMADDDFYDYMNISNGGYTHTTNNNPDRINVKKLVVGSSRDYAEVTPGNSAVNTYMMRLAEVYLNYAEAVLGNDENTTDATALMYVNDIRYRAGLADLTELNYEAIRHERRVEFCLEGLYWYDLLSRSYYRPGEVLSYIESQDRGRIPSFTYDIDTNTPTLDDGPVGERVLGPINENVFRLPYTDDDSIKNPLLNADPVPYEFTEPRITDLFN